MGKGPESIKTPVTQRRLERQTTPLRVGLTLLAAAPFIIRACNNDLPSRPYPFTESPAPTTPIVRQR